METLRDVAATLRFPRFGDDEVTFSEAPKVTVVRDSDGSKLKSEAATTEVGAAGGDIKHWTVSLAGSQIPEVDLLTATWTDGSSTYRTEVEVVGGFVVSVAEIKDKLEEEPAAEEVRAKREIALREIEGACGVAFRPRYKRQLLDGSGTTRLILDQRQVTKVIGVEVEESALTAEEIAELTIDPAGVLIRTTPWPSGKANIEVTYVHGYQSFAEAVLPVRDYAAYLLAGDPTDWNQRATSMSSDGATFALVTPGVRGARFPLPSVNGFVGQYAEPLVR